MQAFLQQWFDLSTLEVSKLIKIAEALGLIVIIAIIVHLILHRVVVKGLKHQAIKSPTSWTNLLFSSHFFSRIAFLIQAILIGVQAKMWLSAGSSIRHVILTLVSIWVVIYALLAIYALLSVLEKSLTGSRMGRDLPLRGLLQSIKLILFIIAALMVASILIGQSPLILLSGLGAMTAVFMLVFRDPILGLVAGIQLSANRMLSVGDWLEMPKYGADGDVIDISLTTVKVQNWDKTITTIPSYALISDSFKNWKGMRESGGRRIKRSLLIDATSVCFLEQDEIDKLVRAQLLEPYIKQKVAEISQYNQAHHIDTSNKINGRRLTNIGSFRAYLERYLRQHPAINQNMTLMVRQLAPTHQGIALELYCFTATTVWTEYEAIQSDIFDHLYAVLPEFALRVAQAPTGNDFRQWQSH